MKKKFIILVAASLINLLLTLPSFSATVGLRAVDPSIVNAQGIVEITPSSTFGVELFFSDLNSLNLGDNGLVGFTMSIESNPLIAFQSFTKSSLWSTVDISPTLGANVTSSVFNLNGYNFGDAIASDHIIGTFLLQCLAPGSTVLNPKGLFGDPINFSLADGSFLDPNINFQSLTVNQVPIPAAVWLLGTGVVGLVALKRRKKA